MSFRSKLLLVSTVPVIALTAIAGVSAAGAMSSRTTAIVACVAALVSAVCGVVLARRVGQPLHELTKAADALANEQLPALVSGLTKPSDDDHRYLAATIRPIEVDGEDEIGRLARAFNAVQTVAVDVAAEQSRLLRKGISDLFMHLARRNQALIERQIEVFDELEAAERDPERLAQLFRLDHLATRMRRNAESLLVLAGVEPARRRSEPVGLADVLRAAIGEIEDVERVELGGLDDVRVAGAGAVDLAHLLAELLENATRSSSPDTRVTVVGRAAGNGYQLTITDQGIGMADDALRSANQLLASPPPVGLALGRALGLTVVSRLAARHGATAKLARTAAGGIEATVHLPASLVVVGAATTEEDASEPLVVADDEPDFDALLWKAWDEDSPASLADALPQGEAFEQGLADLARFDGDAPVVRTDGAPAPAPTSSTGEPAPAGLPRRVPRAVPAPPSAPAPMAASPRSPEEVRAMLSRYRGSQAEGRVDAHGEVLADPRVDQ